MGAPVEDASGAAESCEEGWAGDPDRDPGAQRDGGQGIGLEECFVEDEVGSGGSEALGEAPARVVGGSEG